MAQLDVGAVQAAQEVVGAGEEANLGRVDVVRAPARVGHARGRLELDDAAPDGDEGLGPVLEAALEDEGEEVEGVGAAHKAGVVSDTLADALAHGRPLGAHEGESVARGYLDP